MLLSEGLVVTVTHVLEPSRVGVGHSVLDGGDPEVERGSGERGATEAEAGL